MIFTLLKSIVKVVVKREAEIRTLRNGSAFLCLFLNLKHSIVVIIMWNIL